MILSIVIRWFISFDCNTDINYWLITDTKYEFVIFLPKYKCCFFLDTTYFGNAWSFAPFLFFWGCQEILRAKKDILTCRIKVDPIKLYMDQKEKKSIVKDTNQLSLLRKAKI